MNTLAGVFLLIDLKSFFDVEQIDADTCCQGCQCAICTAVSGCNKALKENNRKPKAELGLGSYDWKEFIALRINAIGHRIGSQQSTQ